MADVNLDRLSIVQMIDKSDNHCLYCCMRDSYEFRECTLLDLFSECPLNVSCYFSVRDQSELPLFCP